MRQLSLGPSWGCSAVPLSLESVALCRGAEQTGRTFPVDFRQFLPDEGCASLGLTGRETFSIPVVSAGQERVTVTAVGADGEQQFETIVRIDTPNEFSYFANGGILPYVLRRLASDA